MARTIRDFAADILFGESLAEKLKNPPPGLADDAAGELAGDRESGTAGAVSVPGAPGRSVELRFGKEKSDDAVFRPGDESERGRGLILHRFANHELMALELMALMLLRFPDAPAGLRRDLVRMIGEEQKHLKLYLDRMRTLNVHLGELPLSDFFWRLMANLDLPAFVAAMNLTFEQANLDHAIYYRDYFARIGDTETARILETVLADEIGHVKGGLYWFRTYKLRGEDDWSAYLRLLPENLSPARARGPVFDRPSRLAAGLSAEFIETLEVFADSRGHPARVFLFDPVCDEAVGYGRPGYRSSRAAESLRRDLETLPCVLASEEDVVLVKDAVSADFRRRCRRAGFEVPRFLSHSGPLALDDKIGGLYPWGWSPDTRRIFQPLFEKIVKEPGPLLRSMENASADFPASLRKVYAKSFGISVARAVLEAAEIRTKFDSMLDPAATGTVVTTIEEIATILGAPANRDRPFVIKSPFSAAGRRRIYPRGALGAEQESWARKQLGEFDCLVLEPWLDRVLDLSWQGDILPDGRYVSHGSMRFLTDAKGRYLASFVGSPYNDLPRELRRFLDGDGDKERAVFRLLERSAEIAAGCLQAAGYQGAFAVDALVYRQSGADASGGERAEETTLDAPRYLCKPVVEVNPRFTMGRVARELARHVWFGARGFFAVLSRAQIERGGFGDFLQLDRSWRELYPIVMRKSGTVDLIEAGYLPLNDPAAVREFLPILWCGPGGSRAGSAADGLPPLIARMLEAGS